MIQLIYVSNAVNQMSEEEVLEILKSGRDNNKLNNITGMLLYSNGNFFQVLEGEEDKVLETYEKILYDKRHKDLIILDQSDITQRSFPDWTMGFKYISKDNKDEIEGYSDFLSRNIPSEEFLDHSNVIIELLYMFKENNR